MEKQKHMSIRIDPIKLKKFKNVASYEGRSASGQIISLINNCIRSFEEKHGEIVIPKEEINEK